MWDGWIFSCTGLGSRYRVGDSEFPEDASVLHGVTIGGGRVVFSRILNHGGWERSAVMVVLGFAIN